mgnify:CR=1 FL=1
MTEKSAAPSEYFEFSKVTRPTLRQVVFLLFMLIGTTIAGLYFEPSYGYVVVFIPYFTVALFSDYSNITFRNTPRLKKLIFYVSFLYLVAGLMIVGYSRQSGWFYDHLTKYFF